MSDAVKCPANELKAGDMAMLESGRLGLVVDCKVNAKGYTCVHVLAPAPGRAFVTVYVPPRGSVSIAWR